MYPTILHVMYALAKVFCFRLCEYGQGPRGPWTIWVQATQGPGPCPLGLPPTPPPHPPKAQVKLVETKAIQHPSWFSPSPCCKQNFEGYKRNCGSASAL